MVATVYFAGSASGTRSAPTAYNVTCTPGDVLVLLDMGNYTSDTDHITSVEGMGATWAKAPGSHTLVFDVWIGSNPTVSSGNITTTAPTLTSSSNRALVIYGVSGATAVATGYSATASSGTSSTPSLDVAPGQAAFAVGYSDTEAQTLSSVTPADGWDAAATYQVHTGRWVGYKIRGVDAPETVSASSTRNAGYSCALMVVIGEADGSEPPAPSLAVAVWEGGQRVSLDETSFLTGGGQVPVTLSGIYETRPAVYYFDPAPVIAGIDAATSIQELESALAPLMTHSVATVDILETSKYQSPYTAQPTSFAEPRLKPFLRYMVESLARIETGKITGGETIDIMVCDSISDGSRSVSGVVFSQYMNTFLAVNQTALHYETAGSEDERAHPSIFMHELAHLIEFGSKDTYLGAFNTMVSDLIASNPPGFTYSAAAADEPFEGEHPLGFPRFYGRNSRMEDFADMVCYMTVPALYPDLRRWMQSDPYLVKKHAVVKDFLGAIGWGAYAVEDMHGHLPLVHRL